jgi:DNA polymerase-1
LCVGLGYEPGKVAVVGESPLRDASFRRELVRFLSERQLIAHNGKFDLPGVGGGKLWFDTMLASYAENEMPGTHGLKYLAREILGAPEYDLDMKRYTDKGAGFQHAPRDLLYRYNAYDVACTYDLKDHYVANLSPELLRLQDFLTTASNALMPVENEGLNVDVDYLNFLTDDYLKDLGTIESSIADITESQTFNPRSPKQVKEYLAEQGVNVGSTDEASLKRLIDQNRVPEFAERMLEHRREAKLYGTYVKGIRSRLHNNHVYPTFLLHGTVSGRLACRNPNLQNVPRESKIRRMYIPSPGNVFVQGDYAQAELRVMATLAEDSYLRGVFNEGRDIHSEVAERFFGPNFTKDQRVRAKAVVFGLAYGREALSLAMEFKIHPREAQRYLDEFFEVIPELVAWRTAVQNQVTKDHEDLVTPFGRHRRFWLITRENKRDILKEALSFYPQSIASDINLSALIRLVDNGLGVRLPVHDSILVECAIRDAQEVAREVKETMEQTAVEVFSDYVKFPVDIAIGTSWGDLE